jgi:hypothetical protein
MIILHTYNDTETYVPDFCWIPCFQLTQGEVRTYQHPPRGREKQAQARRATSDRRRFRRR